MNYQWGRMAHVRGQYREAPYKQGCSPYRPFGVFSQTPYHATPPSKPRSNVLFRQETCTKSASRLPLTISPQSMAYSLMPLVFQFLSLTSAAAKIRGVPLHAMLDSRAVLLNSREGHRGGVACWLAVFLEGLLLDQAPPQLRQEPQAWISRCEAF